jgi:hypothetical protein
MDQQLQSLQSQGSWARSRPKRPLINLPHTTSIPSCYHLRHSSVECPPSVSTAGSLNHQDFKGLNDQSIWFVQPGYICIPQNCHKSWFLPVDFCPSFTAALSSQSAASKNGRNIEPSWAKGHQLDDMRTLRRYIVHDDRTHRHRDTHHEASQVEPENNHTESRILRPSWHPWHSCISCSKRIKQFLKAPSEYRSM